MFGFSCSLSDLYSEEKEKKHVTMITKSQCARKLGKKCAKLIEKSINTRSGCLKKQKICWAMLLVLSFSQISAMINKTFMHEEYKTNPISVRFVGSWDAFCRTHKHTHTTHISESFRKICSRISHCYTLLSFHLECAPCVYVDVVSLPHLAYMFIFAVCFFCFACCVS